MDVGAERRQWSSIYRRSTISLLHVMFHTSAYYSWFFNIILHVLHKSLNLEHLQYASFPNRYLYKWSYCVPDFFTYIWTSVKFSSLFLSILLFTFLDYATSYKSTTMNHQLTYYFKRIQGKEKKDDMGKRAKN